MSALTTEAVRIGDELLTRAQDTPEGWCWATQHVGEQRLDGTFPIQWYVTENLYSGSAGIVFFLAELYRHAPNPGYEQAVRQGARWLWHAYEHRRDLNYGLMTGWMGVAWTLLRVSDVLNEPNYTQQALKIAFDSQPFIENVDTAAEYFSGLAGVAIGLLLIHEATNHEALLPLIDTTAQQLVNRLRWGAIGLFADRNLLQIKGLCGASHGISGVAAAFLELGYYLGNDAFYRLAFQLFQYEDQYYTNGQWPDFRLVLESSSEQANNAFETGNFNFFTDAYLTSAWCHGNVGIAPIRVRAYELTRHKGLLPILRDSVAHHLQRRSELLDYFRDFTLCHGVSGCLEMLTATASLADDTEQVLAYRQQIIDRLLSVKPAGGIYIGAYANSIDEDTSLFTGNAGIGYVCLRLSFPDVPPLLLPTLTRPAEGLPLSLTARRRTWSSYRVQLLNSRYARILKVLRASAQWPVPEPNDPWVDEQANLRDFVRTGCQQLSFTLQSILDEARQLDYQKAEVDNAINPVFELAKCQRWVANIPSLLTLDITAFSQVTLYRPALSRLLSVSYDWSQSPSAETSGLPRPLSTPIYVLTWAVIDQVREDRLLLLGGLLLEAFAQPTAVIDAWLSIESQLNSQAPEQLHALRQRLYEQTLFFVGKGILLQTTK